MPDWLKDFLRERDSVSSSQNSEVEISEIAQNHRFFSPSTRRKN